MKSYAERLYNKAVKDYQKADLKLTMAKQDLEYAKKILDQEDTQKGSQLNLQVGEQQ